MADAKLVALVERLIAKTHTKELRWEPTARPTQFQTSIGQYTIWLSEEASHRDDPIVVVRILDLSGAIIEQVSDEDLANDIADIYGRMYVMYESARRQALGVDKAIDSILNALK